VTTDEGGGRSEDQPGSDRALVVLPTYDESGTLAEVVTRILAANPGVSVLVVDDGSPDGTGSIADGLASDPRVSVLHRPRKLGLGTAYVAGFEIARSLGFRWVVEMDADGSHLPEELPALLEAARAGAGLVLGARWIPGGRIEGWPWYRHLISRTGTSVARVALRSRLRDITSGFRVLDSRWLSEIDLDGVTMQGYGFQVEIAWSLERIGCPISELPITFVERRSGRSKMSPSIVAEALRFVLVSGWRLRLRGGTKAG